MLGIILITDRSAFEWFTGGVGRWELRVTAVIVFTVHGVIVALGPVTGGWRLRLKDGGLGLRLKIRGDG